MKRTGGGYIYNGSGDMSPHEFMIYSVVRGIKPARILEIGIRGGVSTLAMCRALEDGKFSCEYHACDINSNSLKVQYNTTIPLIFHIMSSDRLFSSWSYAIDLLFIDGDHRFEQVKRDYEHFVKFVSKGGLYFFMILILRRMNIRISIIVVMLLRF